MKKLILNISETVYEKLAFEAIDEKKSIQQVIQERILHKPFNEEVEEAFSEWIDKQIDNITKG